MFEFSAGLIAFVHRSVQNPPAVISPQFPLTMIDSSGRDVNVYKTAKRTHTLHTPSVTVGYIIMCARIRVRVLEDDSMWTISVAEALDGSAHHVTCHPHTAVKTVDLLGFGIGLWWFGCG